MYRIRLVTGQEQIYRSIQELTAGVQRGEVTADAEIYHQRSDRWLSIESHPHYRMAADGGVAARSTRLKFTRPSSPAQAPAVLPTPTAQKPNQSDLEELNRLLVLLDPLPTPAQRAEPDPPVVSSPPALSLVRPEPEAAVPSDDPEPAFDTMLSLEDLELVPESETVEAPRPAEFLPEPAGMMDDVRVIEEAPDEVPAAVELVEELPEPRSGPDLGLPVEIRLDVLPVPGEAVVEEAIEVMAVDVVAPEPAPMPEPAAVAARADREPFADPFTPAPQFDDALIAASAPRRFRPMLYVAVAAFLAAAIFAFTSRGEDPNQSMVTLASATAPAASATPAPVPAPPSAVPVSAAPATTGPAVGFPLPDTARVAPSSVDGEAGLLPSAPDLDLAAGSATRVETGASASRNGSGAALARGYANAYADLARDFSTQMDRNGLVRLFNQTQLTTSDGLSGARRALDASAASLRQYRAGESAIEQAYADSARSLERNGASPTDLRDWMTHLSQQESSEAAVESSRLLGQIDAVFALLQAQSGKYKIQGTTIHFDNADAASRYGELQGWITRRLEYWSGQPGSSVPTTVQPILEGIGLTRLPVSQ